MAKPTKAARGRIRPRTNGTMKTRTTSKLTQAQFSAK